MELKKIFVTRWKWGTLGLLAWGILYGVSIFFVLIDGSDLASLVMLPIIFPLTPIIFVIVGILFCHKKNERKMVSILYLLLLVFWISLLSLVYYKEHFTKQRTLYFNIDSDIQNNIDGCYKQFNKTNVGKYGYLQCDYDITYTVGHSPYAVKNGTAGEIKKFDCSCGHSRTITW